MPATQQRHENSGCGKHRGNQNGNRRGEITKFEEQHQKHENDRQREHRGQIAEGILLRFVKPAIFDANRRRQLQLRERRLHGGDAVAHIEAFEARGDGDVTLLVILQNFGLAGQFRHRRPANRDLRCARRG